MWSLLATAVKRFTTLLRIKRITALGFRVHYSRVLDTSMFLGIRTLALEMCRRTGRVPVKSVSFENPDPVGIVPLVEAVTGIPLRPPRLPHDPVADCLATLALFPAVAPQFVAAWERDRELLAIRKVGFGFPVDSVRAAYLPADVLLDAPPLLVDLQNLSGKRYLRQPHGWGTLWPARECLQRTRNIFDALKTLPFSLSDIDPTTCDGFAPHFARFRNVHGASLEGAGSGSAPDPEAAQLEEERGTALFSAPRRSAGLRRAMVFRTGRRLQLCFPRAPICRR